MMDIFHFVLQFPTEELVKEVENSISEFKRHKQEYDEDRIKEQVLLKVWHAVVDPHLRYDLNFFFLDIK